MLHFHGQPEGEATPQQGISAKTFLSYDYYIFRRSEKRLVYHLYKHVLGRFDLLLPCSRYCLRESQGFWHFPDRKLRQCFIRCQYPAIPAQIRKQPPTNEACWESANVLSFTWDECVNKKGSDVLLEAGACFAANATICNS